MLSTYLEENTWELKVSGSFQHQGELTCSHFVLESSVCVQSLGIEKNESFLFETRYHELMETSKAFNSMVTFYTVSFKGHTKL